VTTVRPPVWPTAPTAPSGGADSARQSARGAFFEQALGRATQAQPQAAPAPTIRAETVPQPAAEPVRSRFAPSDGPPQKILRPGSLLDIKV
jgi:hypothetical protein